MENVCEVLLNRYLEVLEIYCRYLDKDEHNIINVKDYRIAEKRVFI